MEVLKIPMNIINIPIRIVGVLGNVLNIIVLGQKNMASPTNSILWWLAVSDIFELLSIELVDWYNNWNPLMDFVILNRLDRDQFTYKYYIAVLWKSGIYLVQVFHTITIALNIILAQRRYLAVAHPLQIRLRCYNDRSARKPVLFMYVLSFIICFPLLYAVEIKGHYYETIWYTINYRELPDYAMLSFLSYAFILKVVPLVILTAISIKFIFALLRTRQTRRGLSGSGIAKTQNRMDRINILVVGILLMFAITDIPVSVSGALMIIDSLDSWGFITLGDIPNSLKVCLSIVILLPKLTLAINCSYNMFFYLMMSTEYRKTLKLLLGNIANRHFQSPERTDVVTSSPY